ncbi:MAG: hypothetical protein WAM69_19810 [Candidatus Sulfotelmatobacter sp.]
MTFRKSILVVMGLSIIAAWVACSSNATPSPSPTPAITVTLGTVPTSLSTNQTVAITATVANDSANAGVTWSCTPANTCGSFNPAQTASGVASTYTAPSAAGSVIITATSVTNTSISASTSSITVSVAVTVTLSTPPPSSLAPGATATIAATVANDPANAGVTWSCTPANTCGSFSPTSTASAATTTYTAPSTTGNVLLTATSVTNTNASASATVTISAAVADALTPGNYVFSLSGTDANGVYYVAGAFAVSGTGAISGGEQDFSDFEQNVHDIITGGNVAASSDGNLLITLTTADTTIGVGGVETLDAALTSGSNALVAEFDSSATSSGTLDLQSTSLAALSAGYAFFTAGWNAIAVPIAIGGVINVDGGTTTPGGISGAGSVFDLNNNGNPQPDQTFTASTVTAPDSFGMVTFTLNPSVASGVREIGLVGYIVDANHIRLVETNDSLYGTMGGTALGQGSTTGGFSTSSVEGSSIVFGGAGQDANGPLQVAGALTANTDGSTVSGTLNFNDIAAQSPQGGTALTGGTYSVDSTGRVTETGLTDGATFDYNLQFYLGADGHALAISMDTLDVFAGLGFPQTGAGSFTAGSFLGTYALNAGQVVSGLEQDGVGTVSADGVGTLTGFLDINESGTPVADLALSGTFIANSSGVFTDTIIDPVTAAPDSFTYYLVDPTQVVAIETDPSQLTLAYFELQH